MMRRRPTRASGRPFGAPSGEAVELCLERTGPPALIFHAFIIVAVVTLPVLITPSASQAQQ